MIDLSQYHLHDLTHTYDSLVDGYSDSIAKKIDDDGWNARWLSIYSHAGTHMDAPLHFGVDGCTIDRVPLHLLMGKAHIGRIELQQNNQLLDVSDLGSIAHRIQPGDSLLLSTGWSEKLGSEAFRKHLPRISENLAHWCVSRKLKILGVEPPSVADVNNLNELTNIHRILFKGEVIIVEGLKNLNKIVADEVFLIALPLKISDGDGAPARVIALEKNNSSGD